jgi:raffinose/stachyose/melibiose transport system permease protein
MPLFLLPSLLLFTFFVLYPTLNGLWFSFEHLETAEKYSFAGWDNYTRLLGPFWIWLVLLVLFCLTIGLSHKKSIASNLTRLASGIIVPIIALRNMTLSETLFAFHSFPEKLLIAAVVILCLLSILVSRTIFPAIYRKNRKFCQLLSLASLVYLGLVFLGFSADSAFILLLLICGILLWTIQAFDNLDNIEKAKTLQALLGLSGVLWVVIFHGGGDPVFKYSLGIAVLLICFNILKLIPAALFASLLSHLKSQKNMQMYKFLLILPVLIPEIVLILLWKFILNPETQLFNRILVNSKIMDFLIYLDNSLGLGGIFAHGSMPDWLNNPRLILPALILFGFPWITVTAMFIFLAGLRKIPRELYECAALDGAGRLKTILLLELPVILKQAKVNIILIIIGTFNSYATVLILFKFLGGPEGKLMLPGLYIFVQAFSKHDMGYACAVGVVTLIFTLLASVLAHRFIKVEKHGDIYR